MGFVLSAAAAFSLLMLQVKPPIQYELKIGDAYTYDMTYGEKGGSDGSFSCKLRVECREPKKDDRASAEKQADYLLRFKLSGFNCSFPQEGDNKRMKEFLATIEAFSFSAEMDRTGELQKTDLQQAVQGFLHDDADKKQKALQMVIRPMLVTIWCGLFPCFDAQLPAVGANRAILKDRDWLTLGVSEWRQPWSILVCNVTPEHAPAVTQPGRRTRGRLVLWRRATEVQSAKDLGEKSDLSMSSKIKIIFREGVCEECEIENQQIFDNGRTSPTAFSRCKLIEQQEIED